jgi:cation diffusion facilitator family transporter
VSIGAAVATIALKAAAWWITGSVGLLSDAAESLVNLVAAVTALAMLSLSARPPDAEHPHGYAKAEYFSSGVEGALILVASLAIAWAAIDRLLDPRALDAVGLGLVVSAVASAVNLGTAQVLFRAARRHGSIALEADAQHLMTDVWTSAGVLVGVGLVAITGWDRLDPIVALAVALNIVRVGSRLVRRSFAGLLDPALPPDQQAALQAVLDHYAGPDVQFHAVRTRQAGQRAFVTLHVLVPGDWNVRKGHRLCDEIEGAVREAIPQAVVFTHLEAVDDPVSFEDQELDR